MRFEGKSAIVTGGARGIGRAIVERLASEGATVLIADIDVATGNRGGGDRQRRRAYGSGCDLRVVLGRRGRSSESAWGKVDILVNNAGIAGRSAPTWELSVEEWHRCDQYRPHRCLLGCRAVCRE